MEFKKRIKSKNFDIDEIQESFAKAIVYVEKELGFPIYEDYLLLKFFIQLEYINYFKKEEYKAMKSRKAMRK